MICCAASPAFAQSDAVDNELKRIDGHWRVIEMVENGNAIPEDQMREWLPGGGVMEIVDFTVIFKSPVDGTKSTKYFRVDPTSYPKRIAVFQMDNTTGTGIYKFDQSKLVICITNGKGEIPNEFNAPEGSGHSLMVMERFEPGTSEIPGLNAPLPKREPLHAPAPEKKYVPQQVAKPAPAVEVPPPPTPPQPTPAPIAAKTAGRILTDTEVRNMSVGTWRINDNEGSIDIVFKPDTTFQTYRYYQTLSNFQRIFVPTPISSGNWSINNGRLVANVTSSTRLDRVNQSFVPAVRSISPTDMILVDHLGRVSRAVKLR